MVPQRADAVVHIADEVFCKEDRMAAPSEHFEVVVRADAAVRREAAEGESATSPKTFPRNRCCTHSLAPLGSELAVRVIEMPPPSAPSTRAATAT